MENLLTYLWKSSFIILIFYGVYILFLNKETHFVFKRYYLLLGVVASFIFPFITFEDITYIENFTPTESFSSMEAPKSFPIDTATAPTTFNWKLLLGSLYFIGFSLMLIRFSVLLISTLKKLKSNRFKKVGKYYLVEDEKSTSAFSFFNYIVYSHHNLKKEELDLVLTHEKNSRPRSSFA